MDEVHFTVICPEKEKKNKAIKIKINESILIEIIPKLFALSCSNSAALLKKYFG